ncbi:MAG: excinuclease ABC subunit UvrC [Alphaproteobacteria bacterium]|nr:excinuclease ABC subunit UvrC [Alphaproteobacteria bacterium]
MFLPRDEALFVTRPPTPIDRGQPPSRFSGKPLVAGVAIIRAQIATMPAGPGVYRMLNRQGAALYVGKARSLRRRVTAYTQPDRLPVRLQRMVAETAELEVITTHTEVEALLLEINLIKQLKPRYNVLLRDDKSFPYILIRADHEWPQLTKHRGARDRKGQYFGPFAAASAVNRTLTALQRAFLLRSCSDGVFHNRTRPCLLHQIKRCSAPCVGRIERAAYDELVEEARGFLSGKSQAVQQELSRRMDEASADLAFETAALYRDRIRALAQIQARQDINIRGLGDADVIAAYRDSGVTCVEVFFFRAGQNYGNRPYFPNHVGHLPMDEVLGAFIGQFYSDKPPPPLVLVGEAVPESALLEAALAIRAGGRVRIEAPQRGPKRKLIEHAELNAREAAGRRLSESATQRRLLDGLAPIFGLAEPPKRIEVYDNSHVSGTNPVGAMIVAGPEGFVKGAYRKFNIRGADVRPGDDYAMLREVLTRRFSRALAEDPDRRSGNWPDLVLIDGGAGQLSGAVAVLAELGIAGLPLAAIAKGPDRDAGRERFFLPDRSPFSLPDGDPVFYFLQRLRDEAHRFAIGSHRARRSKAIGQSILDRIQGVGALRKRALLHHFGSARAVAAAGLADLETVPGINKGVAKKVYDHFHGAG